MGAAFIKMQYIYYVVELFYNLAWFTIAKFDSPVDKAMLSSFLYVTCDMIPCKLVNAFYLVLYTFVCKKSPCQAISAWKAHGAQRKGKMHPSNLCRNSNNNAKNFANSQDKTTVVWSDLTLFSQSLFFIQLATTTQCNVCTKLNTTF